MGEHILLGGDNMDLALAYAVAGTLPGGMEGLDPSQRVALTYACRNAKETLFSRPEAEVGHRGGTGPRLSRDWRLDEDRAAARAAGPGSARRLLPRLRADDQPARGRRVGLTEIGLPYAADAAITKHLARFLNRQAGLDAPGRAVDQAVGHPVQRRRIQGRPVARTRGQHPVAVVGQPRSSSLATADLDLAVARGAAYYGLVRLGQGVRIRGGVPRSYYVGVETAAPAVPGIPNPIKAMCVVPMGMEEGSEIDVAGPPFGLIVGEPAVFRFLSSTIRRDDPAGTVLDRWNAEELMELEPLETTLTLAEGAEGETIPIRLHSRVTEVGTLELWCHSLSDDRRWKLEFNVREPEA